MTSTEHGGHVVFINAFKVPVEQFENFEKSWHFQASNISKQEGFIDMSLFKVVDNFVSEYQFFTIAHWISLDAMQLSKYGYHIPSNLPSNVQSFPTWCYPDTFLRSTDV